MINQADDAENDSMSMIPKQRKSPVLPILIGSVLGIGSVLFVTKQFLGSAELIDVTQPIVDDALKKWEQHKPADYRIQIEVKGNLNGVYDIKVHDNEVVEASFGDQPLTDPRTLQTWSVPGMMRMLEYDLANQRKLQENGIKLMVRAEFDPEHGFPSRYQRLDYSTRQATSWKVVGFSASGRGH